MRHHVSLIAGLLLMLVCMGCYDNTHIQRDYTSNRDECRAYAESHLAISAQPTTYPMTDKEKNNSLLQLFSDCMKKHEWKVAGPKKDKDDKPKDDKAKDANATAAPAPTGVYTPPPGYALVPVQTQPATVPAVPAVAPVAPAAKPPAPPMVTTVAPAPPPQPQNFVTSVKPATPAPAAVDSSAPLPVAPQTPAVPPAAPTVAPVKPVAPVQGQYQGQYQGQAPTSAPTPAPAKVKAKPAPTDQDGTPDLEKIIEKE
jgi:hypothetical protein